MSFQNKKQGKNWNNLIPIFGYSSIIVLLTALVFLGVLIVSKIAYGSAIIEKSASITNNLATPVVAFTGIILTFLAFWQQYNANFLQKNQFLKQSFESHFFELLKLYGENVKGMKLGDITGRKVFEKMYEGVFTLDLLFIENQQFIFKLLLKLANPAQIQISS